MIPVYQYRNQQSKRQKQLYAITEVRWNSGPQMIMCCPKRSRAWKGVQRTKIPRYHFILKVKFYNRPTWYKTILLIADSGKNNNNFVVLFEQHQVLFHATHFLLVTSLKIKACNITQVKRVHLTVRQLIQFVAQPGPLVKL